MNRPLAILVLLWPAALPAGEGTPQPVQEEGAAIQLPLLIPPAAPPGASRTRSPLPPRAAAPGQVGLLQQLEEEPAPQPRPREQGLTIWRPALAASAAVAVAGAAVAWWSTAEADAAYDRYLRSAGARRQQQAFERAERHDRIAGAAFLAMEAGIVLTACLVFF